MTHIAIQEESDRSQTAWMEKVRDDQYCHGPAAAKDANFGRLNAPYDNAGVQNVLCKLFEVIFAVVFDVLPFFQREFIEDPGAKHGN
jgi:hypothetical protein